MVNSISYSGPLPSNTRGVSVFGLIGGKSYTITVEAHSNNGRFLPVRSNPVVLNLPTMIAKTGGPLLGAEFCLIDRKKSQIAVAWPVIETNRIDLPIDSYQIFIDGRNVASVPVDASPPASISHHRYILREGILPSKRGEFKFSVVAKLQGRRLFSNERKLKLPINLEGIRPLPGLNQWVDLLNIVVESAALIMSQDEEPSSSQTNIPAMPRKVPTDTQVKRRQSQKSVTFHALEPVDNHEEISSESDELIVPSKIPPYETLQVPDERKQKQTSSSVVASRKDIVQVTTTVVDDDRFEQPVDDEVSESFLKVDRYQMEAVHFERSMSALPPSVPVPAPVSNRRQDHRRSTATNSIQFGAIDTVPFASTPPPHQPTVASDSPRKSLSNSSKPGYSISSSQETSSSSATESSSYFTSAKAYGSYDEDEVTQRQQQQQQMTSLVSQRTSNKEIVKASSLQVSSTVRQSKHHQEQISPSFDEQYEEKFLPKLRNIHERQEVIDMNAPNSLEKGGQVSVKERIHHGRLSYNIFS